MSSVRENAAAASAKPQKRARFAVEEWILNGNEVVTFRLVEKPEEWQEGKDKVLLRPGFKPEYTHQVFSEDEEVKGYQGLSIDVFVNARDFTTMVEVKYSEKAKVADDVDDIMAETFQGQVLQGPDSGLKFEQSLSASQALSLGDYGQELDKSPLGDGAELVITCSNLASASEAIRGLHSRMQPFLVFFIDGASTIDQDDPNWELLLAIRQEGDSMQVMGLCTVHSCFAYPDSKRLQVSQIMVLPPYQKQGVAGKLISSVMKIARETGAKDVTYEDPTPTVQRLRERVDLLSCKPVTWLHEAAEACVQRAAQAASSSGNPKEVEKRLAPPKDAVSRIQAELKLTPVWFMRVWESLLLPAVKKRGDHMMAILTGYMKTRIGLGEGDVKHAKGKRTWDTETGFVMAFTAEQVGFAPVLEDEEMSEEQRAELVAEAVGQRLEEIEGLLTP